MKKATLLISIFMLATVMLFAQERKHPLSKSITSAQAKMISKGLIKRTGALPFIPKPVVDPDFLLRTPQAQSDLHEQYIVVYNTEDEPVEQYTRMIDSRGLLISETLIEYDDFEEAWSSGYRTTNSYNNNGWVTETLDESYDNDEWVIEHKMMADFSALPTVVLSFHSYDEDEDEWFHFGTITFLLNANFNPIWQEMVLDLGTGVFQDMDRTDYSYNQDGELILSTYQRADFENGGLRDQMKIEYSYNKSESSVTELTYYWENEQWMLTNKLVTFQNANLDVIREEREDYYAGSPHFSSITTHTYSTDRNRTKSSISSNISGMNIVSEIDYTYDTNNNSLSGISQMLSPASAMSESSMLAFARGIGAEEFDIYGHRYEVTLTFGTNTTTPDINSHKSIRVYPNPISNLLTIESEQELPKTIQLIELQGRQLKTLQTASANKIQWKLNDIAPGIYLLQSENGEVISRVIKK